MNNLIEKIIKEYRKKFWKCCNLGICYHSKECIYKGTSTGKSNSWYCNLYK